MNITRFIKIVSAICICAICFIFIPNLIGSDFYGLQMTFYGIFSIILIFIFYKLFGAILRKDRSSLPVYDYRKEKFQDILISPSRVIFFSMVLILFPVGVLAFFIYSGFLQRFKWTSPESYPPLLSILILGFVLYKGVRLWMRRNEVVQLRFTTAGIEYMPVDISGVGRGRGASIVTMYFKTKMVFLNYNDMDAIAIDKNAWRGDMIRITTISKGVIFLPFLPNDDDQLDAVYGTFVERWSQVKSRNDDARF
ncbi:hypothetical protein SAMN05216464_110153 [Mucilaginibacter pineti]|uniref:Uncharacterized protein n=1 Tax=Mucilaginibacter pineti TaxID=1391627 RepID=A0A1G7GHZ2_9SPHI|nr:hypothetical protein [Mucilaginibacter pineti]SDE87721.1 hypothetical protein SAMN05216464_110153 [Mucilaginibacter pineti]